MNNCKYCGKPLTLTPEYDTCMECQGRIMREATMPQNSFATNSTKTATKVITHEEAKINVSAINGWHSEELENELMDYITQQQTKDKRAKKEHELLGWYRLLPNSNWTTWVRAMQNIKILEKELEEMK